MKQDLFFSIRSEISWNIYLCIYLVRVLSKYDFFSMKKKLQNNSKIREIARALIIAIIAVLIASLVRKVFLASLDDKVVWITFYPAVMVAAILGGFFSGMLTSIFTILIVIFQWQLFIDNPFIVGTVGTVSAVVFLINCSLISGISEYSRQQKIKANIQKEKAEQASKAKSNFLANISHELRTPLNAILGFTRLMQDNTRIPTEEQKNLKIINNSGEHLLGLINNVLDIAKIESGRIIKTEISFNLENTIYEISQLMSQQAAVKELQLKTIFKENTPQYIKTDKQKLRQILINLIGNAIKFTKQGKITLSVNREIDNEELMLVFEVKDSGIGIEKEDFQKIFKPFGQSDNTNGQKGTGLGLTISKQYAELLGGSISVESKMNFGSKFIVKIPITTANTTGFTSQSNKFMNVNSIAPGQGNFRILIVEDQIENWLLLQRIHEKVGIQVKIAKNGLDGIEIFKEWKPHLIWMDVRMPVMDGLEATKQIRNLELGKKVKIIGISAHVFKDEIKNVMSVGMDSFIKKPYQFHEIYECLNKQLGIQFIFNKTDNEVEKVFLTIDMLEKIDSKLRIELEIAIKNLNDKQIKIVINKIQEIDTKIGQTILFYTKNLKYTEIYRLLNHIKNKNNE